MKTTIQALDRKGSVIDNARWEVDITLISNSDKIYISLTMNDHQLLGFIQNQKYVGVDASIEESQVNITLEFTIKNVKHLINVDTNEIETLIEVVPTVNSTDLITRYIYDIGSCDPNFVTSVRRN